MAAAKVLFFILLFCLLLDHRVQSTLECAIQDCTEEELCLNERETNYSPTDKCRFVVVLEENCSFKAAMGGSYEKTKESIDNLQNSSSTELKFFAYVTSDYDAEHFFIIFSNPDKWSKWIWDDSFASDSGCDYESNMILCTLLHDTDDDVNETIHVS